MLIDRFINLLRNKYSAEIYLFPAFKYYLLKIREELGERVFQSDINMLIDSLDSKSSVKIPSDSKFLEALAKTNSSSLEEDILNWKRFQSININRLSQFDTILEIWNSEENKLEVVDDVNIDKVTVWKDPKYFFILDYTEYTDDIESRNRIFSYLKIADFFNFDISNLKREVEDLDYKFKTKTVASPIVFRPLSTAEIYYPESRFWWLYRMPHRCVFDDDIKEYLT